MQLSAVALVVGLLCVLTPAASQARLNIGVAGLEPAFRSDIHDYTVSCTEPVRISVRTPGPSKARIGAARWSGDAARRQVRLSEGQGIKIVERLRKGARKRYFIRCLPEDFPDYRYQRSREPSARFYVITPGTAGYVIILDRWGVPMWWYQSPGAVIDAKVLDDGTIVWARYSAGASFGAAPGQAYEVRRPDGKPIRILRTVGSVTDFHDLQPTPDGNYMLLSYRPRSGVDTSAFTGDPDATVLDGVVQELTPSGQLVSEWSTEDDIALAETSSRWWDGLSEPYDTTHINAVEPLPRGDFLISLRHTDAVYRIDGTTGGIEWKLGGEPTPQSLEVEGDPFGEHPLGGQHDVRWLGKGHISLFDNGTGLDRAPRAVRYKIAGGVATLLSSASDQETPESPCCGSARVIGKSFLTSWGGTSLITETDFHGRRNLRLHLSDAFSYRAVPITNELTRSELRAGMNSQTAPKD
jgi:Arylsulfotransferase (ASST)